MGIFEKLFPSYGEREIKKIKHYVDEINALELSKYCSDDLETIKDTMLELRIMKYVKYDPETNMLLAGPSRYDEWDDYIIEDLHNKAQKKNKSDNER